MSKSIITKRIAMLVVAALVGVASLFAQTTRQHTVKRGETLDDIAALYGTTKDAIIQLNPDAAQFVYVGMELQIPEAVNQPTPAPAPTPTPTQTPNMYSQPQTFSQTFADNGNNYSCESADYNKWNFAFQIGYGILKKPEGSKGSCFAYAATVGATYSFTKELYAGARIGYNSSSFSKVGYEYRNHFISLPVEIGCKIGDKFGLMPYVGMDFNYCVKSTVAMGIGKNKEKKTNKDAQGELATAARLGARVCLWGFGIGAAYVMPVGDKQKAFFGKDAYPEISISACF